MNKVNGSSTVLERLALGVIDEDQSGEQKATVLNQLHRLPPHLQIKLVPRSEIESEQLTGALRSFAPEDRLPIVLVSLSDPLGMVGERKNGYCPNPWPEFMGRNHWIHGGWQQAIKMVARSVKTPLSECGDWGLRTRDYKWMAGVNQIERRVRTTLAEKLWPEFVGLAELAAGTITTVGFRNLKLQLAQPTNGHTPTTNYQLLAPLLPTVIPLGIGTDRENRSTWIVLCR